MAGAIFWLLSLKYLWLVELAQLSSFVALAISIYAINEEWVVENPNNGNRQRVSIFLVIAYFLQSNFTSATWFHSAVSRVLMFGTIFFVWTAQRIKLNDDITIQIAGFIFLVEVVSIETSVYINVKAKASLFVKMKRIEQQERQLSDIMDAVPDCVFICSKASDGKFVKSM